MSFRIREKDAIGKYREMDQHIDGLGISMAFLGNKKNIEQYGLIS